MPLVVDTSVIIAVILNEPTKPRIIEITKGQELIAPESIRWEIGNAFSALFKRKILSLEQALTGLKIFEQIPLRYPVIDFYEALKIAHEHQLYAYDAYFLKLSQNHKCPFITLDSSLQKLADRLGIKTFEVSNDRI
ncbi:PIN domain-containing protein [candidate division KSB1 bacterium]|nr:PIN domain-containing protein [candidate division KSB1 bacterium]